MRLISLKTERWFLISILTISIILRILSLSQHDFWFDEAITFYLAKLPLKNIVSAVLSDSNPPVYYLLMHLIAKLNHNEVFLRIPSVVASLFTIPLIYFLTKKFADANAARSASFLFTVSPLSIYVSTEARLHSLATLFAISIAFIFLNLIEKFKVTSSIFFIAITTIALYTHFYIALLYIPLSIIAIKLQKEKNVKKTFVLLSIPLIAFMPWVFFFLISSHNDCSCPNSIFSLPASLVSPSIAGVGIVSMRSFTTLSAATIIIFTLASLLALVLFLRGVIKNILIASIYLLPLAVITIAGLLFPVFSPKGFSIFSPFFFIIVAVGINSLSLRRYINFLLIILLFATSIIQLLSPFFKGENLKLSFQTTQKMPDTLVAHTSLVTFYSFRFYAQDKSRNYLITNNPLSFNTQRYIGGKPYEIKGVNSFWLADTPKWTDKGVREKVIKDISRSYWEKEKYTFDQITLTYFKKQI